jgi:hypothetical protein
MIGYHTLRPNMRITTPEYSQFDSFQWQIIPIVCFTGRIKQLATQVFTDYGDSFDPNSMSML